MTRDQAPAPTPVDVSNEAVERLAIHIGALEDAGDGASCAATLRALAAQRDELLAALDETYQALAFCAVPGGGCDDAQIVREARKIGLAVITRARGGAA
jgi:hypothetical protein